MSGSAITSLVRHAGGALKGTLLSAALIAALLLAPATTFAAPGGNGGGGQAQPWIALSSVNGVSAATAQPSLGTITLQEVEWKHARFVRHKTKRSCGRTAAAA